MHSLEHQILLRFTGKAKYKPDIIAPYLAGLLNSISTTFSTFSIIRRSPEYKTKDRRTLGRRDAVTKSLRMGGLRLSFQSLARILLPSTTLASSLHALVGTCRSLLRLKVFGTSLMVRRIRIMCWVGVSRPSTGRRCEAPQW
jgi:hypothetical protein